MFGDKLTITVGERGPRWGMPRGARWYPDSRTISFETQLGQTLEVTGSGQANLVYYGPGRGDAVRSGSGNGTVVRNGGRGSAIRKGSGDGDALKCGGFGDAVREGSGSGSAIVDTVTVRGRAIRSGSGDGDAVRDLAHQSFPLDPLPVLTAACDVWQLPHGDEDADAPAQRAGSGTGRALVLRPLGSEPLPALASHAA